MRKIFKPLALLASATLFSANPLSAETMAEKMSPEDQLATIMSWWNGDYNNDAQIARLEAEGRPVWRADDSGKGGHIEVTSHYRPVALPAFGEHVIYVEETKYGDPTAMFRQRVYTLSVDDELQQVRVKLWNFKDKEKYVGAWKDLSMLDKLMPEEMSPLPDKCDLYVSPQDDRFHMPMRDRDCAFGDRYFSYQVLLGADSFWFRDKIVRLEDEEVLSISGEYTYHELDRMD